MISMQVKLRETKSSGSACGSDPFGLGFELFFFFHRKGGGVVTAVVFHSDPLIPTFFKKKIVFLSLLHYSDTTLL